MEYTAIVMECRALFMKYRALLSKEDNLSVGGVSIGAPLPLRSLQVFAKCASRSLQNVHQGLCGMCIKVFAECAAFDCRARSMECSVNVA